jgi:hypothetical protein
MMTDGIAMNAVTAVAFSPKLGDLDLTECVEALDKASRRVAHDDDMGGLEAMLTAQTVALNAMFTCLADRAKLNLGTHLDASERYMRLALRTQSQCRATVESLAFVKNPGSAVFAKQANIANGPQQVNNATKPPSSRGPAVEVMDVTPRAPKSKMRKTKLLGAHGQRVD